MGQKTFGYVRVSSNTQNEGRQVDSMLKAGVDERDIIIEKQSGKDFKRPQYQALLSRLREGDTLIILSIDRLGRNYYGIMEEWRRITRDIGANIKVLDMPLLDTTNSGENLDGKFIANLVLEILCYVADKERQNIKERQRQGIELMKAQGRSAGRPTLEVPPSFPDVYARWKAKDITAKVAMEELGLKRTSFYKYVNAYEEKMAGGDSQTGI